jgi:hypothetical protein
LVWARLIVANSQQRKKIDSQHRTVSGNQAVALEIQRGSMLHEIEDAVEFRYVLPV